MERVNEHVHAYGYGYVGVGVSVHANGCGCRCGCGFRCGCATIRTSVAPSFNIMQFSIISFTSGTLDRNRDPKGFPGL